MAEQENLLQKLRDHLKVERTVHQQLLQYAEEKRERIVKGEIEAFSACIEAEKKILDKGQELGRYRAELLRLCAVRLEINPSSLRMAQVLELAPEPLRSELQDIQLDLRSLLERLREINDRNMVLIRQSLGFVHEVMNMIVGESRKQDYARDGQRGNASGASSGAILDSKG